MENVEKAEAVVFDLDGTIANVEHRRHLVQKDKPDWDGFYNACEDDEPVLWVISLLRLLKSAGKKIVILSARGEEVLHKTIFWLDKHGVEYDELLMRPKKDYEPDEQLKIKLMKEVESKYKVWFIVDDRQKVVDMWRKNGYNVLQCAQWAEFVTPKGKDIDTTLGSRKEPQESIGV